MRRLSIIFFVGAVLLSLIGIVAIVVIDPRLPVATPTARVQVVAKLATDVPIISAIPPTLTPSITPSLTNTPSATPTPLPPTATDTLPPTAIPATATQTPLPRPALPSGKRCVSVVGDSVAHGDAVFEIPGVGYFVAQLAPASAFIDQQVHARGLTVLNRSVSAVGISSSNHPSYFGTPEYAQLLQDNCQYVVIFPWVNDMSSGSPPESAAPNHVNALASLARNIVKSNAHGVILIVNYYAADVAPFAQRTFASGYVPSAVTAFNQQIAAACSGGALLMPQVRCIDANGALAGADYTIGATSQQALGTILAMPPSADDQGKIDLYFSGNPNGALNGDRVHLSNVGKAALASALARYLQ